MRIITAYNQDNRPPMTKNDVLQTLVRFQQNKQDEYHIIRIGIFGSAARDSLTAQSDVDVVVELTEPDLFVLIGIKQDLEELLHRPVDIVRYREKMNPSLKRRIEQEAVYV
ncbi:MAG: nucleotidyltransferase domain-containing protein [Chloroflexota bacterium]